MDNIDVQLEKLIAQNMSKVSAGGQTAFAICANSFQFGCNWGFLKVDTKNFKETIEVLKQEKGNIRVSKMKNGVLIFCNEKYLMYMLNTIMEGKSPVSYPELASRRKDEFARFDTWLKNLKSGKVRNSNPHIIHTKNINGRHFNTVTFALYSVNDSSVIKVNNISYPAFKITFQEALQIAQQNGITPEQFMLSNESRAENNVAGILKEMTISTANTGAFITMVY